MLASCQLEFASLGSGSKGNGTLVRYRDCLLLVDCGFTRKETERRLARLGLAADQLDAILVTHEHSDHMAGVGLLARKYQLPVYITPGTLRSRDIGKLPDIRLIKSYCEFAIKSIEITPVAVPHDAAEPAQFIFQAEGKRLGVLTDLGSITPHVELHYQHCDALLLEANHDPKLLSMGKYPPSLKQRVAGAWGHLSNGQAANFIAQVNCERLQRLVVGHISQQNNTLSLAQEAFESVVSNIDEVHYACQEQGFDWLPVE